MFEDAYYLFLEHQEIYVSGVINTIRSAAVGLVLAFVVGLLVGIVRFFGKGWGNRACAIYVSLVRNTPLLVQIYFIYFGLPAIGITIGAFETGIIALTFNSGAYIAEIIRGALQAIPRGQFEAAASLGLRLPITLLKVILPQAAPLAIPAISGQFVQLIKDTSLLYTIAVLELTKAADEVGNETYSYLEAYLVACVLYVLICMTLNVVVDAIEKKFRYAG